MSTFGISDFVKRQTPESRFSHYSGEWSDLVHLCESCFHLAKRGYRDGVMELRVVPGGFFSGVVRLKEGDKLVGRYEARHPGETPRKSTGVVGGQKMPAKSVTLILYYKDVLAENNERSCDTDWELISINASPEWEDMPMSPGTLMANHFGMSGGTATKMTDAEFVQALKVSCEYWADKALISGE